MPIFSFICFFYRSSLLNESQTQNMYCLWFIPIKVVAGHFVGETLTIYAKLFVLMPSSYLVISVLIAFQAAITPEEYTVS